MIDPTEWPVSAIEMYPPTIGALLSFAPGTTERYLVFAHIQALYSPAAQGSIHQRLWHRAREIFSKNVQGPTHTANPPTQKAVAGSGGQPKATSTPGSGGWPALDESKRNRGSWTDSRDHRDSRDSRDHRDHRDHRDGRDYRDSRDSRRDNHHDRRDDRTTDHRSDSRSFHTNPPPSQSTLAHQPIVSPPPSLIDQTQSTINVGPQNSTSSNIQRADYITKALQAMPRFVEGADPRQWIRRLRDIWETVNVTLIPTSALDEAVFTRSVTSLLDDTTAEWWRGQDIRTIEEVARAWNTRFPDQLARSTAQQLLQKLSRNKDETIRSLFQRAEDLVKKSLYYNEALNSSQILTCVITALRDDVEYAPVLDAIWRTMALDPDDPNPKAVRDAADIAESSLLQRKKAAMPQSHPAQQSTKSSPRPLPTVKAVQSGPEVPTPPAFSGEPCKFSARPSSVNPKITLVNIHPNSRGLIGFGSVGGPPQEVIRGQRFNGSCHFCSVRNPRGALGHPIQECRNLARELEAQDPHLKNVALIQSSTGASYFLPIHIDGPDSPAALAHYDPGSEVNIIRPSSVPAGARVINSSGRLGDASGAAHYNYSGTADVAFSADGETHVARFHISNCISADLLVGSEFVAAFMRDIKIEALSFRWINSVHTTPMQKHNGRPAVCSIRNTSRPMWSLLDEVALRHCQSTNVLLTPTHADIARWESQEPTVPMDYAGRVKIVPGTWSRRDDLTFSIAIINDGSTQPVVMREGLIFPAKS